MKRSRTLLFLLAMTLVLSVGFFLKLMLHKEDTTVILSERVSENLPKITPVVISTDSPASNKKIVTFRVTPKFGGINTNPAAQSGK